MTRPRTGDLISENVISFDPIQKVTVSVFNTRRHVKSVSETFYKRVPPLLILTKTVH